MRNSKMILEPLWEKEAKESQVLVADGIKLARSALIVGKES